MSYPVRLKPNERCLVYATSTTHILYVLHVYAATLIRRNTYNIFLSRDKKTNKQYNSADDANHAMYLL